MPRTCTRLHWAHSRKTAPLCLDLYHLQGFDHLPCAGVNITQQSRVHWTLVAVRWGLSALHWSHGGAQLPFKSLNRRAWRHLWRCAVHPPAPAGPAPAGCSGLCPGGFGASPQMQTPQQPGHLALVLTTLTGKKVFLKIKWWFMFLLCSPCLLSLHGALTAQKKLAPSLRSFLSGLHRHG